MVSTVTKNLSEERKKTVAKKAKKQTKLKIYHHYMCSVPTQIFLGHPADLTVNIQGEKNYVQDHMRSRFCNCKDIQYIFKAL